jgi:hypothetical protein
VYGNFAVSTHRRLNDKRCGVATLRANHLHPKLDAKNNALVEYRHAIDS